MLPNIWWASYPGWPIREYLAPSSEQEIKALKATPPTAEPPSYETFDWKRASPSLIRCFFQLGSLVVDLQPSQSCPCLRIRSEETEWGCVKSWDNGRFRVSDQSLWSSSSFDRRRLPLQFPSTQMSALSLNLWAHSSKATQSCTTVGNWSNLTIDLPKGRNRLSLMCLAVHLALSLSLTHSLLLPTKVLQPLDKRD